MEGKIISDRYQIIETLLGKFLKVRKKMGKVENERPIVLKEFIFTSNQFNLFTYFRDI